MNLSENLSHSFDYAKKMFSDAGRLIILIILNIIPLVNWIVIGYAARVLRETPGTDTPPKLENYGDMFVDGAKIFFASLIYMVIPAILVVVGVGSFIASRFFGAEALGPGMMFFGGTGLVLGLVLVLVAIILAFFLLLILGVGIAHMIKTRSFGKAFAFSEILSIIRGIGWGRYIGWAVVTVIIVIVVGGIAGAIPVVGWIISAIIGPILTVFVFRSLGLLYNEGAPAELRVQAMPSVAGGMVCASCGSPLQPYHKFCPSCGASAPVPATQTPPTTMDGTKFCITCGARIPTTANFCGSCGAKQT